MREDWQLDFTFWDDKNKRMAKTGAKNLQNKFNLLASICPFIPAGLMKLLHIFIVYKDCIPF